MPNTADDDWLCWSCWTPGGKNWCRDPNCASGYPTTEPDDD